MLGCRSLRSARSVSHWWIPPKKMGVYMGIFNFFIVLPQIVNALIGGPIVRYLYNGNAIYAIVTSGVSFLIAAMLVKNVKDVDDA